MRALLAPAHHLVDRPSRPSSPLKRFTTRIEASGSGTGLARGEKKRNETEMQHTPTGPEQQSQYTCRQPHSDTYRGGKSCGQTYPGRQLGTTTLFRRRGNAPAAGELLSCPAAARRSSPLQLPEREWAHRGLRQRGSSRQRPGAVQRAWRLRSRCHPHQPRHLQVQHALEGPLLRLCGVPFVWVRCRPR